MLALRFSAKRWSAPPSPIRGSNTFDTTRLALVEELRARVLPNRLLASSPILVIVEVQKTNKKLKGCRHPSSFIQI
jgi:hypothetical protein